MKKTIVCPGGRIWSETSAASSPNCWGSTAAWPKPICSTSNSRVSGTTPTKGLRAASSRRGCGREGRQYIFRAPAPITYPGLAIFLAVLGFNLFGDGLRDALDPRMRVHHRETH
ncbi:MAG: hypothetical protein HY217_10415 [Candidatus Rokubacteria bacterium]|nr:hypothetical protein [Candidatus Rokubacteria bacterium]